MQQYKIKNVEKEECQDKFLTFRCKEFATWSKSKHKWFYEDNVYGKATCLILSCSEDDEIIGSTAVFPRRLMVNNSPVNAGITGDFGVSAKHRSLGPALKLQGATIQCCIDGKFDMLYGYANKLAGPVQKRAGFKLVGYPLRYIKYLSLYPILMRYIKIGAISRLLSIIFDGLIKIISLCMYSRRIKNYSYMVDCPVDDKFNVLWRSSHNSSMIVGERDEKFLQWRFEQSVAKEYRFFCLYSKNKEDLIGYLVFYEKEKHIRVADMFCIDEVSVNYLLKGFTKWARRKKYHSIDMVYFGNVIYKNIFKMNRFIERENDAAFYVYIKNNSEYESTPLKEENWYYFEADSDS